MTEKTQTAALIPSSLHEITRQFPALKQSIMLDESAAPRSSQAIILASLGLLFLLVGWALIAPLQQSVNTTGEMVTTNKLHIIQSTQKGIISELPVAEGDQVQAGQLLMKLVTDTTQSDSDALSIKAQILQVRADRLQALSLNKNFETAHYPDKLSQIVQGQKLIYEMRLKNREEQRSLIMEQIEQRRAQLALTLAQEHEIREQLENAEQHRDVAKKLFEKKLGPELDYRQAEDIVAALNSELRASINQNQQYKQEISEEEGQLVALDAQLREESLKELAEVTKELTAINEQKAKMKSQFEEAIIKAPSSGLIKGLSVHKVGGTLQRGQKIAQIIPLENIEIHLQIPAQDIAAVKIGQGVQIKDNTDKSWSTESLEGQITAIASHPYVDADKQSYYQARVTLTPSSLNSPSLGRLLAAGMKVKAEIQTSKKQYSIILSLPY
ncbi:HlyD family type I secretion periplasmic adaptor subunit [Candidatus Odyssella thessalonicensis]|uniref:HlyD family type I secretion periplasmic adaptor subunit n=1 Tax=Candidatus Odyssella thessalonicensis TaxID=84647 RepID=UPI000225A912|nr:HlyD family type I secretion periplasmic adaptor subunit [Candidatus Odyssella thessalonicensis]